MTLDSYLDSLDKRKQTTKLYKVWAAKLNKEPNEKDILEINTSLDVFGVTPAAAVANLFAGGYQNAIDVGSQVLGQTVDAINRAITNRAFSNVFGVQLDELDESKMVIEEHGENVFEVRNLATSTKTYSLYIAEISITVDELRRYPAAYTADGKAMDPTPVATEEDALYLTLLDRQYTIGMSAWKFDGFRIDMGKKYPKIDKIKIIEIPSNYKQIKPNK